MSHPLFSWKAALTCCLFALAATAAKAQEPAGINWRTDYASAREESEKKNLPLLIYVTKPFCPHCVHMEQSTYVDARILAACNSKVIPLKVNLADQPKLVASLDVNWFPTIILARPDAQYETLKGYQEADILHDKITRVLASLKPNEAISRDFDNAQKWEAAGEYARAISALRNILDDTKSKPLQKSAQDLLQKIEKRAEERLGQANELQAKGKLVEALEVLSDVQQRYAGVKAAVDASEVAAKITQANGQLGAELRLRRLRELTAQAEEFYKSKDYIPCLYRCAIINREFGDLPEARKAYALAAEIKNNPQWMEGAADVMTDFLGNMWLDQAEYHLKRSEPKKAEFILRRVVTVFPGSRLAESAQIRLNQLQAIMPAGNEIASPRP
jgi:thioredoxin-like negative regulator of GroEL